MGAGARGGAGRNEAAEDLRMAPAEGHRQAGGRGGDRKYKEHNNKIFRPISMSDLSVHL